MIRTTREDESGGGGTTTTTKAAAIKQKHNAFHKTAGRDKCPLTITTTATATAATNTTACNDTNTSGRITKFSDLMTALHAACRKPLFTEIVLRENQVAAQRRIVITDENSRNVRREQQDQQDRRRQRRQSSQSTSTSLTLQSAAVESSTNVIVNNEQEQRTTSPTSATTTTAAAAASNNNPLLNRTGTGGTAIKKRSRPVPAVSSTTTTTAATKTKQQPEPPREKTWEQLLSIGAQQLPYMTEGQQAEVLRVASILLLGFLLPYSTGNEFVLLQQPHSGRHSNAMPRGGGGGGDHPTSETTTFCDSAVSGFDPVRYVINMSLEERLEKSVKRFESNEYGEMNILTDTSFELAFDSFLSTGLAPLLYTRPFCADPMAVDLLHVIAMAVHPQPSADDMIPHVSRYLNRRNTPAWSKAKRLMSRLYASQFQINYKNRLQLVVLVADHLMLNELEDCSPDATEALLHGAIPHLRSSLRAFARSAMSVVHGHVAYCALVNIACQTQNKRILEEEWNYLLHTMVEDHVVDDCSCSSSNCKGRTKRIFVPSRHLDTLKRGDSFCLHRARGQLLSEFIARCFRSKTDVHLPVLLPRIAGSLTDAIEWQVDCWSKDDEDEDTKKESSTDKGEDAKQLHPPCLLSALLASASSLFHFLPIKDVSAEEDSASNLTESAMQLLRHKDNGVANAAAELLIASLSHRFSEDSLPLLLDSYKLVLQEGRNSPRLENVVALASNKSSAFAYGLLVYLINSTTNDLKHEKVVYRSIATVCANCPQVASKLVGELAGCLEHSPPNCKMQIAASIFAVRLSRFFAAGMREAEVDARRVLLEVEAPWGMYKMAGYLLETGNFHVACDVYDKLLQSVHGEKHFLWISSLHCIACAEAALAQDAAQAIPVATTKLRAAGSYLQTIESVFGTANESYGFQICFVLLRLDFLDLITVLRQLTREMRLTGSGPTKFTRSFVHLLNVVQGFGSLSGRYDDLIRRYGMRFYSGRSRWTLQVLRSTCLFLVNAIQNVFKDVLPPTSTGTCAVSFARDTSQGQSAHPLGALVERLAELVVQPMDSANIEPIVRAAAMLELLDGVLMAPIPFPREFLCPYPRLVTAICSLVMAPEPGQTRDNLTQNSVDVFPGLCFTVSCSGRVPEELFWEARTPSWAVLISHRFLYDGPLDDEEVDEAKGEEDNNNANNTRKSGRSSHEAIQAKLQSLSGCMSAQIFSNGRFYAPIQCPPIGEEGHYTLELRIYCRDVAGNEWELRVPKNSNTCSILVSRSL